MKAGQPDFTSVASLPEAAFEKADPSPDELFYLHPRFVTHIDEGAIGAVSKLYRERLPAGGNLLDLMSSWVSHLPPEIAYRGVIGLGMNADELAANPRLTHRIVQDLNDDARLPYPSTSFDGALLCVSVQYLQRPIEVFGEVCRVLVPGAPFVVTFSNRCFPTKAVAIWRALNGARQQQLVSAYMLAAGFDDLIERAFLPAGGDPLWTVIGHAAKGRARPA